MYDNEIMHYGVLGMKWGKRRYQNKDNTLTDAGNRRKELEISNLSDKKKRNYKPNPNKWVEDDMEGTKKVTDASANLVNQLKNVNGKRLNSQQNKSKMDLSTMTDKELRDRINRAFLEKQYNDMFAETKQNKGREYADKILEYAGDTLTLTSSALAVALAIKKLRG